MVPQSYSECVYDVFSLEWSRDSHLLNLWILDGLTSVISSSVQAWDSQTLKLCVLDGYNFGLWVYESCWYY